MRVSFLVPEEYRRMRQPNLPSRPEAIRRLTTIALQRVPSE
jgi:hypothetical protein